MSIPNKNSRKIVVANEKYRWIISLRGKYIIFIAEHEEFKGRRVEFHIYSKNKIVTPKDVADYILEAIDKGWNPKEKGSPLIFNKQISNRKE